jgi:hypothetical protein
VQDVLETIPKGARRPTGGVETEQAIICSSRKAQLGTLSRYVFDLSEHEDSNEVIDLDYPNLLTGRSFVKPGYFPFRQDHVEDCIRLGEQQGTEDFLSLIVPDYLSRLEAPELYFAPWKKELLRRRMYIHDNSDGSAVVTLPTRLPNIDVHYYYQAHHSFPKRVIALATGYPA